MGYRWPADARPSLPGNGRARATSVSDAARLAHPKWLDPDIPRQLNTQTDGGVAIIGGAFVEYHLRRLLKARMRALPPETEDELFEGLGPLASQTGRIEIAFAFNLIGAQVRNDLRQINEIRNKFAHVLSGEDWTFDHPEIGRHVDALSLAGTAAAVVGSQQPDNRGKFIMTVYYLTGQIAGEVSNHQQPSYFPKFLAD
jgi:hypothetical protein